MFKVGDIVRLKSNWKVEMQKSYIGTSLESHFMRFEGETVELVKEYKRHEYNASAGIQVFGTRPSNSWVWRSNIFELAKEENEI